VVAVRDLVLASEPITRAISARVGCPIAQLTGNSFIEKLLWKIGFSTPQFSDTLSVLRRRLDTFNQELLAVGTLQTERDRERIRSAGVNLFVSIEEFLDQVVSYNIWLLASDHFLVTHCLFDSQAARSLVPKILGSSVGSAEQGLEWDLCKTNTLGPLMAYLHATTTWIKGLLGKATEAYVRPEADLPHFADYAFRIFPFRHTVLWADSDSSSIERLAEGFAAIAVRIARSNLASIRNGLDHHRDEAGFPKLGEMLAFVAQFREAVDMADVNRFFPKEFWLSNTKVDQFGRREFVFRDYLQREHVFYGPPFVHGLPAVRTDAPLVIAPGNLLGFANAEIVFGIRQKSVYSDYWDGYPRRRHIPSPHKFAAKAQMQPADGETASPALPA
jgi:hypothetical protein